MSIPVESFGRVNRAQLEKERIARRQHLQSTTGRALHVNESLPSGSNERWETSPYLRLALLKQDSPPA